MKLEDSTRFTSKCFHGEPASCSFACPFHLDIRSYLEKLSKGRWGPAYKTYRNAVVFPAIVSALCDQPCRAHCQRVLIGDEALAMRDIEAACVKHTKNRKPELYIIPPKTQRIAVIGAGPAGLSCALNLAQKKFPITIFEKENGWGGSLRSSSKFAEFDADIALQFSSVKVEFRFESEIKSLDELAEFEIIFIATGSGGNSFGLGDSWDPELLSTSNPKTLMGGALCGATLMEGIAQGVEASKTIEVILQTGKASRTYGLRYDKKNCERYLQHEGAVSAPLVKPANAEGYTEEEVKAEAARCLQCDCTKCIDCCEMLKYFRKNPHKIAVEVFNDMGVNPPFSVRTVTREVYSCNICGYCKSVCPVDVDMGKLIQFSRTARMSAGIHPSALHDFWLREMDFAVSEGSFVSAPAGKETCAYVFYPGCQLGASNPDHVLMSYEFLSKNYDAGIFLGCCGAPAYWAGDEGRMRANTEKIKKCWGDLGNPAFIYACPTCASMLSLFLPEINKISLYELLAQSDEIAPERIFPEAAIFDPCAARDYDQMQADIRKLAVKAGVYLEELKAPNHCCGYGGHIRIAKPDLYNEIAQHRIEASPKPYIAYCANCKEVFLSQGKECVHILDMAFGLKGEARIPSLQQKRENSLVVKKEMMKKTRDIDYSPERHEWDGLILKIGDEVQRAMEERLISADDLKEAIWQAETSGDKFYDESDGMFMCSMVRPVITYWTQYKKTAPDTYEIFSAYSHRMRFNVEE